MTANAAYIHDVAFDKLRVVVAMNLAGEILKNPDHENALLLEPLMTRVDEIICLEQQLFPESIKGEEPPADYFDMDESAFEVPAE